MFVLLLAEGGIYRFTRRPQARFEFHTLHFFFCLVHSARSIRSIRPFYRRLIRRMERTISASAASQHFQ
jgi:hypothetical protein